MPQHDGSARPQEDSAARKQQQKGGNAQKKNKNPKKHNQQQGSPQKQGKQNKKPKQDQQNKQSKPKQSKPKQGGKNGPQLRIIPLGGLDAIGKNMTVFECGDDMFVVDAGLMFPDDEHVGVDLILPDYTYILENVDRLRGIVVTHGHEDHTGSLPYLLKDLGVSVPIYGTKLTIGMIEGKLAEHRLPEYPKLNVVHRGSSMQLGCFTLHFFTVTHSIPGSMGLFIESPAGTVLHMGDFKFDETPIDGEANDYGAIARFADQGVDLLMSDSTNSPNKEFTPSESEVGVTLRQIIGNAEQRVIVATFSSHIHRIQQVCDAARLAGRSVLVTGRSMLTNTRIARELGYLQVPDNLILDSQEAHDIPPDRTVVLCTGSQGEPLSALSRMAIDEHKSVQIEHGDTVIISATPVPGNEKAVTRVINNLAEIGADVYDKKRAMVHVSGHAGSEELKIILKLVHPKYFLPVHGEAMHLRTHAKLAEAVGMRPDHIFVLDNGDSLIMQNGEVRRGESVESGIVYVDGSSVGDLDQDVLRDRQTMATDGAAGIIVNIEHDKPLGQPLVLMRGVPGCNNDRFLEEIRAELQHTLRDCLTAYPDDSRRIEKTLTDTLSKKVWQRCHLRPVVTAVVNRV